MWHKFLFEIETDSLVLEQSGISKNLLEPQWCKCQQMYEIKNLNFISNPTKK
jgi:hypothetical protein